MISNLATKSSEKLSETLFNIFQNAIHEIKVLANKAPDQIIDSVHLIRKRLKFLRAFVKLTRFCSGGESYKPINYMLRDSGQLLSDCRDTHVRGLLLNEFNHQKNTRHLIDELIRLNDKNTKKIEKDLLSETSVFDALISDISNNEIAGYFNTLEPDANCFIDGLSLGYEKSYHAFHSELESHDAELLHEWRKRTKDLQYQLEVLRDSLPDHLSAFYDDVAALCEILGRINDLFMFLEWLDSTEDLVEEKDPLTELKENLNLERRKQEKLADKMGELLFTTNADKFKQKLRNEITG